MHPLAMNSQNESAKEFSIHLTRRKELRIIIARTSHNTPKFLSKFSTRIINEVRGINRVAYDISSKPPATIEWE